MTKCYSLTFIIFFQLTAHHSCHLISLGLQTTRHSFGFCPPFSLSNKNRRNIWPFSLLLDSIKTIDDLSPFLAKHPSYPNIYQSLSCIYSGTEPAQHSWVEDCQDSSTLNTMKGCRRFLVENALSQGKS